MGKASSSKKVARAARAGGPVRPGQRKLAFPAAIAAIVVLGIGLIIIARQGFTETQASAESPSPSDHWHSAYAFYVCDTELPALTDIQDQTGLHTHNDGIMHVHPFSAAHAGKNATFSKWGEAVGVQFGSDSITMPDGTVYEDGYDCNGQPATLKVYEWPADDPNAEPVIYESGFGDIRLDSDRAAYTIAVVPDGVEVPRPSSIATLDSLSDVGGATSSTLFDPAATIPLPSDPTASSVPGDSTASTVAGEAPPSTDPAAAPPASETTVAPAPTP